MGDLSSLCQRQSYQKCCQNRQGSTSWITMTWMYELNMRTSKKSPQKSQSLEHPQSSYVPFFRSYKSLIYLLRRNGQRLPTRYKNKNRRQMAKNCSRMNPLTKILTRSYGIYLTMFYAIKAGGIFHLVFYAKSC